MRSISTVLLVISLQALAPGCTGVKRWLYAGWGRDAWQQPDRVVGALELRPGDRVADLGAGGGYFTFRLADAVGRGGRVYAVDVDRGMVEYVDGEAARRGYPNVEGVLAATDDARLPAGGVDLVFTCDTYHHLSDRVAYFRRLGGQLEPGARVAIIDFDGRGWFARVFGHYTPAEEVRREMEAAGYRLVASHDFIDRQSFQIFAWQGA